MRMRNQVTNGREIVVMEVIGTNPSSNKAWGKYMISSIHTVPVKSLDTPTHSRVFLYFYYFLHCRITVKLSKLLNNTYGIM
jgi:hypothetical protein